jgi:uncharacterized membrane protein
LRDYLLSLSALVILSIGIYLLWEKFLLAKAGLNYYSFNVKQGTDWLAQQEYILSDVPRYCLILFSNLMSQWKFYVQSAIGVFGWTDTYLPPSIYLVFCMMIIFTSLTGGSNTRHFNWFQRIAILGLIITITVVILTALYLYWSPVGSSTIIGVQGRYFIPFLPLLIQLPSNYRFIKWSFLNLILLRFLIPISLIVSLYSSLVRYYY